MSLSIIVGILSGLQELDAEGYANYKELFARLNGWLPTQGLKQHQEPESLFPCGGYSCGMFYSGLHTLRRIAAYQQLHSRLPTPVDRRVAADDTVLKEFYSVYCVGDSRFDHLAMHSDCEGLYLPQDFAEVLYPPDSLSIPGGMIGSTPRLLRECLELARAMQLPTEIDPEGDEVSALMISESTTGEGWRKFGSESFTCLHLIRACQTSIETGAAIVFS